MTTATFSCAGINTDNTTFRAWVSAIDTALGTVLTRGTDTGQINTATVTVPGAANTSAGYSIFRFADTLQATKPIFIKVEFCTNGNTTVSTGGPLLRLTIGKSTDGAGNIGSILYGPKYLGVSTSAATDLGWSTSYSGIAVGGNGKCSLVPWLAMPNISTQNTTPVGYFHIERINSGDGLVVMHAPDMSATTSSAQRALTSTGLNSSPIFAALNYTTGAVNLGMVPATAPYSVSGVALGTSSALAAGSIGPVFPWIALAPGLAPYQMTGALTYPGGDAPGSTFTVTLDGVTRTYYPVPLSDNHNCFGTSVSPGLPSSTLTVSRYLGLAVEYS